MVLLAKFIFVHVIYFSVLVLAKNGYSPKTKRPEYEDKIKRGISI